MALVECVPNFSEGRDPHKIKAITDAISAVPGVKLLDVDPGADTHRTVVTFVGEPQAVVEAAFRAIAKAAEVIDMRQHHGAHPRMGATDVCPLVPVEGVTLEECADLARQLGDRVGRELAIPVYFYEAAASRPERRNLAHVRKGEYEGLRQKLADPEWQADAGPSEFNAQAGATVIGAREFLIAYNVTLNTRDKALATDIAFELREKGRVARQTTPSAVYSRGAVLTYRPGEFPCGNCSFVGATWAEVTDHCQQAHGYEVAELLAANDVDPAQPLGQKVYRAGKFKACKAIGWYVETYQRAQISINLTDWRTTAPHEVLEEARRLAAERGLVVTGSEIVGLVPAEALLRAGAWYLQRQGKSAGVPLADLLSAAVFSMGLADVQPFDMAKKVLGLPKGWQGTLAGLSLADLADEVSRDTPAPGGGSIAAACGSLGAALAAMVANLAQGKVEYQAQDAELQAIAVEAQPLKDQLLRAVDADTKAFEGYMQARRLPTGDADQKARRETAMLQELKNAVEVPMATAEASYQAILLCERALHNGNPASLTDAAVGAVTAFAGVQGGVWNVLINLKDIADPAYVTALRERCAALVAQARSAQQRVSDEADARLSGAGPN
jgi:glutamate formiminotransferase/formiminotetrahydrofolate cyclodeaminase